MEKEKSEKFPLGCLCIYIVVFPIAGLVLIGVFYLYFKVMGGWDNPQLVLTYITLGIFVVVCGVVVAIVQLGELKNKKNNFHFYLEYSGLWSWRLMLVNNRLHHDRCLSSAISNKVCCCWIVLVSSAMCLFFSASSDLRKSIIAWVSSVGSVSSRNCAE